MWALGTLLAGAWIGEQENTGPIRPARLPKDEAIRVVLVVRPARGDGVRETTVLEFPFARLRKGDVVDRYVRAGIELAQAPLRRVRAQCADPRSRDGGGAG